MSNDQVVPQSEEAARLEGNDAIYIFAPTDSIHQVECSADLGYWCAGDEECREAIRAASSMTPRHNVIFIVGNPQQNSLIGYAIVAAMPASRSSLKEFARRDLPRSWEHVVRVSWLRVAKSSYSDLPSEVASSLTVQSVLSGDSGRLCCKCIEDAAQRMLPRDIPAGGRGGGPSFHRGGGTSFRRGGQGPMSFRPHDRQMQEQQPPPQYGGGPQQQGTPADYENYMRYMQMAAYASAVQQQQMMMYYQQAAQAGQQGGQPAPPYSYGQPQQPPPPPPPEGSNANSKDDGWSF